MNENYKTQIIDIIYEITEKYLENKNKDIKEIKNLYNLEKENFSFDIKETKKINNFEISDPINLEIMTNEKIKKFSEQESQTNDNDNKENSIKDSKKIKIFKRENLKIQNLNKIEKDEICFFAKVKKKNEIKFFKKIKFDNKELCLIKSLFSKHTSFAIISDNKKIESKNKSRKLNESNYSIANSKQDIRKKSTKSHGEFNRIKINNNERSINIRKRDFKSPNNLDFSSNQNLFCDSIDRMCSYTIDSISDKSVFDTKAYSKRSKNNINIHNDILSDTEIKLPFNEKYLTSSLETENLNYEGKNRNLSNLDAPFSNSKTVIQKKKGGIKIIIENYFSIISQKINVSNPNNTKKINEEEIDKKEKINIDKTISSYEKFNEFIESSKIKTTKDFIDFKYNERNSKLLIDSLLPNHNSNKNNEIIKNKIEDKNTINYNFDRKSLKIVKEYNCQIGELSILFEREIQTDIISVKIFYLFKLMY
jgi:hypothetical protein